jgi:hypothetical protein
MYTYYRLTKQSSYNKGIFVALNGSCSVRCATYKTHKLGVGCLCDTYHCIVDITDFEHAIVRRPNGC